MLSKNLGLMVKVLLGSGKVHFQKAVVPFILTVSRFNRPMVQVLKVTATTSELLTWLDSMTRNTLSVKNLQIL